jgi:hypothetical protein
MEIHRPIPGWIPSTPDVRGGAVDEFVERHPAIAIHFWAPGNGSDPPMDRGIQAIAERFSPRVAFFSCNVDLPDNAAWCRRCGVATVPTLATWVSGELRGLIVGCREPDQLAAEIESRLAPARKPWWMFFSPRPTSSTRS